MNTKNKIVAMLMASIVAMAMAVPMAFGGIDEVQIGADVQNVVPVTEWQALFDTDKAVTYGPASPEAQPPLAPNLWPNTNDITKCVLVHDDNGVPAAIDTVEVHINNSAAVIIDTEYLTDIEDKITQPIGCWEKLEAENIALYNEAIANCETYQMYYGHWDMDPCIPAGINYDMQCRALDMNGVWSGWNHLYFNITSIIGLELDKGAVSFGAIAPGGARVNVTGDNVWGVPDLTIRSLGNDPIDIEVNATDLTNLTTGTPIANNNVGCKIDASVWKQLNQTFNVGIECSVNESVGLSLYVPVATKKGDYSGTVKFTAEHA